ncbi:MAG: NlpC/P60 family protein [Sciscionella sp.]
MTRGLVTGALAAITALGVSGTALAVPPPPPNPSDSAIHHSKAEVSSKAAEVGRLTNQVSAAQAQLQQLADDVELKREMANKALVDMHTARTAATRAAHAADNAKAQANAAGSQIETAQANLDAFAAGSYEQGSRVGSVSAFIGSKSPENVLERAALLNAVSSSKLDALDTMQRARTDKANKDSLARAALQTAQRRQVEAEQAKRDADSAKTAAVQAQSTQQSQTSRLQAQQTSLESQLAAAQSRAGNLQSQRANYNNWLAQKQAEQEAAARRAALGSGGHHGGGGPVASAAHGSVAAVIARAKSVLGMPYAWGGGNSHGPTYGIHDGGIADSYGDYNKIGFDCSGLMVYAFAAAGVYLPHYSGYQYTAGRHVSLSDMQPGDMLFYGGSAGIHHVTLYIGNGMMIEAPESGEYVHITPVRYGGIMPYATRVL